MHRVSAVILATLGALIASPVAAAPAPSPTPNYAGEQWWVPFALQGERLTTVRASPGRVDVLTASGRSLSSTDGGHTFAPAPTPVTPPPAHVVSGNDEWLIRDGTVLHAAAGAGPAPDAGAPALGSKARLIAAPASAPGVVVAVSDSGVVWRRTDTGVWSRALLLLPRSIVSGIPAITSLAAFTSSLPGGGTPVSVYLATDGYAVLATQNGGLDWFRDGPGLPDSVLGLAVAPDLDGVLAATSDGLFIHHLRALPGVPQYAAPDLSARQRWTTAITVASSLGGGIALWLGVQRRPRRRVTVEE